MVTVLWLIKHVYFLTHPVFKITLFEWDISNFFVIIFLQNNSWPNARADFISRTDHKKRLTSFLISSAKLYKSSTEIHY